MTGAHLPRPDTPDIWWIDRTRAVPQGDAAPADLSLAAAIGAPTRRERFLITRRAVRRILGAYLGLAPLELPIVRATGGKPVLAARFGLAFNISHCGDWTVLAAAAGRTIGVDAVDDADFTRDGAGAVTLVASVQERATLAARGDDLAAQRRLWTRKEAVGKALGGGLLIDLAAIELGLSGDGPDVVRTDSGVFHVVGCPAPANVTAALCAPVPLRGVRLRNETDAL